jgi:hypothetical protein
MTKRHDLALLLALSAALPACTADDASNDEVEASTGTDTTTSAGTATGATETGESSGSESSGSESTSESSGETGDTTDTGTDSTTGVVDPNEQIPPPDAEGCHAIYAQDLLPEFSLTIAPDVLEQLEWEWVNGAMNEAMGIDPNPYHPLDAFQYEDIVITDAQIRLRGNPDFWEPDDKLQYQISFNEVDPDGRFLGLRKILFDAATFNRHMLRDRLSLSIMRDMGLEAPCANNARVVINGEYYGIFTNLEKIDKEFLQRVFVDDEGDLWKRANWELETNELTSNDMRLDALKDAVTVAELEQYLDLEQALKVFAAEAILPNSDGMWAGGLNFYLYDDPTRGKFVMLPWDLDNTFERFNDPPDGEYPINPDPVVWEKQTTHGRPWYDLALTDPEWFSYYILSIEAQLDSSYQPAVLHEKIDTWTAQIEQSVLEDVNKPYPNSTYYNKVEELHEYVQQRYEFLDQWLVCWQMGGTPDAEGYCVAP